MNLFKSKVDNTIEFLEKIGAKKVQHTRGLSLYHHLTRLQKIILFWGLDETTQVAALCHSLYSTEYFKTKLFDIEKRHELQKKIGEEAENLVYLFAKLDRKTFRYTESGDFSFKDHSTGENICCSYDDGIKLLHIMFANDLDHIDLVGIGSYSKSFERYRNFYSFLSKKALEEINRIVPSEQESKNDSNSTYIRFIAHSGVQIADEKISVVVDPWLYDSNRNKPIILGLDPSERTIDYLIPEPKNTVRELSPDIVCVSHFHTHHSPLQEIIEFVKIKPITIVCPLLTDDKLGALKQKISNELYNKITFIFIEKDVDLVVKNVKIRAMIHRKGLIHSMYYVQLNEKSILHIVDAEMENSTEESIVNDWSRVIGLRPTVLFIGAAGHIQKRIQNGRRYLKEGSTLTPVQAAKLTMLIRPFTVAIIGVYNHSVWDDRYEMGFSLADIESQFYWSLSFLAPSIQFKKVLPGEIFT